MESSPGKFHNLLPRAASLSEIQNTIQRRGRRIVEYAVGEGSTLAFVIGADTLQVVRLGIRRDELEKLIERVANVFSGNGESGHSWSASFANFDPNACIEAYQKILKPVLRVVPDVDELTIIPDGILAGIPFECFLTDDRSDANFTGGQFVIKKMSINYATTATSLIPELQQDPPADRALLAIGNPQMNDAVNDSRVDNPLSLRFSRSSPGFPPLPGAEKEVMAIQNEFEGNATVLLGKDASREKLRSLMQSFLVIHFATHTSIVQEGPLGSAMYLAQDEIREHPDNFRPWEFSASDLKARLVVLSSCNTIRFERGFDEAGFLRGLSEAGVPSIVGCLWSADDNTAATLMARFYHYLWAGDPISKALQKAKIDLINSGKVDPYYWAPFVLFGTSSPLDVPRVSHRQTETRLLGYLLALFVLAVALIYWKRAHSRRQSVRECSC